MGKQTNANGADAKETQRYTIGGDIINNPQRGININKDEQRNSEESHY